MIVGNIKDLQGKKLINDTLQDVEMKVLVGEQEGWDNHVMRVLDVGVEGYSPRHSHPWPHINYMIKGQGELLIGDKSYPVSAGSYAYVPADTVHQFRNVGTDIFQFICIVPKQGHTY